MNRIFSSRYFYFVPLFILIFLWQMVHTDPFFGDAISSTSRAALHIYNHDLLTIFYPADHDPGHPTLYAWLLAAAWKLFGKTLFIAHLYSLVWLFGLLFVFQKLAFFFYRDRVEVNKATLLFMLMPTVLSQGAMMMNTLAVMTFFLAALYGLFADDRKWFLAGSVLMMITHLEGSFFLLSLACADVFVISGAEGILQRIRNRFGWYLIPVSVFTCWLMAHYFHTGWLVRSPQYTDANELNGFPQFFRSVLLIGWRLVDFGMLPFYIIFLFCLFRSRGQGLLNRTWLVLTVATALPMAFFLEHTIGHRYFLAFALLMIIAVCSMLKDFPSKASTLLYIVLLVSLSAGNFLFYPGKNMGDGNLAYRSYFELSDRVYAESGPGFPFWSHAPIANEAEVTRLGSPGLDARRIDGRELDSLPAIIQSNVNAEFTISEKKYLAEHFYGNSYESGAVYINVFLNPRYYSKPEGWKLREPGDFERWMTELKQEIKGQ